MEVVGEKKIRTESISEGEYVPRGFLEKVLIKGAKTKGGEDTFYYDFNALLDADWWKGLGNKSIRGVSKAGIFYLEQGLYGKKGRNFLDC